mmetsp:Transcript_24585/g.73799  ORF Transcript_24585/g.73799 Transcript_24585/m.73799 type:complete len:389 (-) Transcript_24585:46-1212(-)
MIASSRLAARVLARSATSSFVRSGAELCAPLANFRGMASATAAAARAEPMCAEAVSRAMATAAAAKPVDSTGCEDIFYASPRDARDVDAATGAPKDAWDVDAATGAPTGELARKAVAKKTSLPEVEVADHAWRQTNHIWSAAELEAVEATTHQPQTASDHVMRGIMSTLYHSFNFVTGYKADDPSPGSVAWRLIILESFAGVPGFVAAGFRHFYSLRTLKRDHGSIYTFLEEAENERMHLLVCMKMFDAGLVTRALVIAAQFGMTPFLMATYMVHPGAMHRFVGYLEETAVQTYANLVEKTQTPGTQLHEAWHGLDAPDIAKAYWKLDADASWCETLKHMLADESHHRDVNHTFATLPEGAENPFIAAHKKDFERHATEHAVRKLSKF